MCVIFFFFVSAQNIHIGASFYETLVSRAPVSALVQFVLKIRLSSMASSEEDMSEVVIVTMPQPVQGLPSAEEQDKAVLVAAELTTQPG